VPDNTCRLFIALSIPESIKDSILSAQSELRAALPGKAIGWTKREQFHVTLKFMGRVEVLRIEDLVRALQGACDGFGGLRLRAGGIGMFPNTSRPRVVWAKVLDGQARLPALHRLVENASSPFTDEEADRAFTGHVTIGRCKAIARSGIVTLAALASGMERRSFGDWTADGIEVVRSELAPGGSRHTTLAVVRL
jgi:2'-5' RNA ligase